MSRNKSGRCNMVLKISSLTGINQTRGRTPRSLWIVGMELGGLELFGRAESIVYVSPALID